MGRFSPTVTPTWGESIGNALQGSVQSYLQTRRQRMEDELNLYGHGLQRVQPGAPNAAQPATPTPTPFTPPNTASVNAGISQGVGGGVTPQAIATALPQGPQPNFKGRPSPGQGIDPSLVAEALSRHVQSGAPLTSPNAAPAAPQPAPQQIGAALGNAPTHLMGWDVEMTPQARANMQIAFALKNAEIDAKSAEAFKNRREGGRLQLGDSGYAAAEGERAGSVANAQVPAHVSQAVQTALATLPLDIQKMVAKGQIDLNTALAGITARGKVEAGLQAGQHTFQHGENERTHAAAAALQRTGQEGAFQNKVGELGITQSASPTARITRAVMGAPPLPTTGAGGVAPSGTLAPLTPQQKARASSDPDYAAFLKTKGYE